ncbi:carbohydrate kinase [Pseudomonas alliivorans]|uniref:carbohydrate kinase family protein n=1 Tax=Pseudomonas alliivorans TaxID=2810613 RepID=UPI001AE9D2F7|nr:carbohydrate kinase [Pseudomonas alliivorans]MBP0941445.1 carbohydrate kinase [Pseudomonas alliivorans]MEE4371188.1 carbohydrate kinase [Pseudomonas alliivorans]MEE4707823.1 carbohydrate kinase [Pseudomonas alliivorans]MEE4779141.1 carbohydrate kinase [Pseudomonas alliivorans]MEE4803940.1 carbohydrate kinase [Pseudomonas alliivorans]
MFLVCGEALFDIFTRADTGSALNKLGFDAIAGGSPFNVAIGLRRLGVESALFAGLSTDYLGSRLRAVLEDEQVGTAHLIEFNAPTTLAMVAVGADGSPTYSFRGEGCADRQLRLEHLPRLDDKVRGIHVGSFSLVVQPIADTLLALVARESGKRLISLDPNVRLNPAPDIGRWRSQIAAFAEHAHMIKVSDEDLHLLYPDRDPETIAKGWLNRHTHLVIVTRGTQGASIFTREHGTWSIPAKSVVTVDTVGAGDTFQAALLTFLTERQVDTPKALSEITKEMLDQMLEFAASAAALTCTRVGPDLPYRDQLR